MGSARVTNLAMESIDVPPPLDGDILFIGETNGHRGGVCTLRWSRVGIRRDGNVGESGSSKPFCRERRVRGYP